MFFWGFPRRWRSSAILRPLEIRRLGGEKCDYFPGGMGWKCLGKINKKVDFLFPRLLIIHISGTYT